MFRWRQIFRRENGFSELEFVLLTLGGVGILGVLAHFLIDQSLQSQRLQALVSRDSVRFTLESNLQDRNVLGKSAMRLPTRAIGTETKLLNLRACILGEKNCDRGLCCESHIKASMPVYDLSEQTRSPIAGTSEHESCLDGAGQPISGVDCFATSTAIFDPICAGGAKRCDKAAAIAINLRVRFLSPFLANQTVGPKSSESDAAYLDQVLTVVLDEKLGDTNQRSTDRKQ